MTLDEMNAKLCTSVAEANIEHVRLYLELGANPNAKTEYGFTALHFAHTADIAELLIEAGADLNVRKKKDKRTPLHQAFWEGNVSLVLTLIRAGADRSAMDLLKQTPEDLAFRDAKTFLDAEREAKALEAEAAKPAERSAGRGGRI